MNTLHTPPPQVIPLVYRTVGKTHVFTADGFAGFYIASSNLRNAFDQLGAALSEHVSAARGCNVVYSTEFAFEDFENHFRSGENTGNIISMRESNGKLERPRTS